MGRRNERTILSWKYPPTTHCASLLTLLCVGSLQESLDMALRIPEQRVLEGDDFDMRIKGRRESERRRSDEINLEFLQLLRKEGQKTGNPRVNAAMQQEAIRRKFEEGSWVRHGVVAAGQSVKLCVMISGDWGPEWPLVADWFVPGAIGDRHILLAASTDPAPALMRPETFEMFQTFLVGKLPSGVRDAFSVASGICIPWENNGQTPGPRGALYLRRKPHGVECDRLVIWPENNVREDVPYGGR